MNATNFEERSLYGFECARDFSVTLSSFDGNADARIISRFPRNHDIMNATNFEERSLYGFECARDFSVTLSSFDGNADARIIF